MLSVLFKIKHRRKRREYEPCILCGKITDIPRNRPILERDGYIRGCGQTCRSCYRSLYTM